MAEVPPSKRDINDLFIETDKLYVGSVLDLLNNEYNTVNLPEIEKFYPRANEHGFILHKQKINTAEETGQKIIDLRRMYDNFFYPRHYNHHGVSSWYHRDSIPFSYSMFNYLMKLEDHGFLEGKKTRRVVEKFIKYLNVHSSEEKMKARISEFKLGTSGGNLSCELCYPGSNYYGPFVSHFLTGLLTTADLNIFSDYRNFSIEASERIIHVFNDAKKLVAVICKILKSGDHNSIGYIAGDQAGYLVTKDHDILFVNYHECYHVVTGEELDYDEYIGPIRKPV